MEFPRQEYWSELPFPSPGDLPNPGIEPTSPALAGGFFTTEPPEIKVGVKWYKDEVDLISVVKEFTAYCKEVFKSLYLGKMT